LNGFFIFFIGFNKIDYFKLFEKLKKEIEKYSKKDRAKSNEWFFKTGKGEYGEGDKFLGLTMGEQRAMAKKYKEISFSQIKKLLDSKFHEERMIGLLILVYRYEDKSSTEKDKREIYDFYIKNRRAINNWDLVDVTTPNIIGDHLSKKKNRKILYKFAKSKNLWEKRVAILATYKFIREGDFKDTLKISEVLLRDKHDLIHKAVGWMLREVGKQDVEILEKFLDKYVTKMPRTMLRYAIEKFSKEKYRYYLKKK